MNKISNALWGIVFIVIGVIIGLNAMNITAINLFFKGWWTLFIIIPCFIDLFKDHHKTGNIIGLIIGVLLLLGCQGYISFMIISKMILPIILIGIGVSILFKDGINSQIRKEMKKLERNKEEELYATFSGQNVNYDHEEFKGANVNAVFGGFKCDLRNAYIKQSCIIDASAIFGGVTVYVPDSVNVRISSTSIFGGVSDKRKNKTKDNEHTVYIHAICMFGGVEIK